MIETGAKRKSKMSQKDSNQNDIQMTTNHSVSNTTAVTSNNKKDSAVKFSNVNLLPPSSNISRRD